MKKVCSVLLAPGILFFLGACHSGQPKDQAGRNDSSVVKIQSSVSDTLAAKMNTFLQTYYKLKKSFTKTDSAAANKAAMNLLENLHTLSLQEMQADSARYNRAYASLESLDGEIAGLLGEKTMLGKRREFQMISDMSYDLIKTVGLKGQTVYRDFCPMFNNGNGAYWLSGDEQISNPYYGQEMPGCGEVKEVLKF